MPETITPRPPLAAPKPQPKVISPTQPSKLMRILVGVLATLLVVETVVLGYVLTRDDKTRQDAPAAVPQSQKNRPESRSEQIAEGERQSESMAEPEQEPLPPLVFTGRISFGSEYGEDIRVIDRQTGQEKIIYSSDPAHLVKLVAVPQRHYDGRIFIGIVAEGKDFVHMTLHVVDVNSGGAPQPIYTEELAEITENSYVVSPDQTHLAYVPYDFQVSRWETGNSLISLDLLSGDTEVLGQTENMYFYSQPGVAGLGSYQLVWLDSRCLETQIYSKPVSEDPAAPNEPVLEKATYCLTKD